MARSPCPALFFASGEPPWDPVPVPVPSSCGAKAGAPIEFAAAPASSPMLLTMACIRRTNSSASSSDKDCAVPSAFSLSDSCSEPVVAALEAASTELALSGIEGSPDAAVPASPYSLLGVAVPFPAGGAALLFFGTAGEDVDEEDERSAGPESRPVDRDGAASN